MSGRLREDGRFHRHAREEAFLLPAIWGAGDAIDMVVHMQGCTKAEALEFIVGKKDAPIARPAFRPAKESSPPRPATTTADALALFQRGARSARDPGRKISQRRARTRSS